MSLSVKTEARMLFGALIHTRYEHTTTATVPPRVLLVPDHERHRAALAELVTAGMLEDVTPHTFRFDGTDVLLDGAVEAVRAQA